MEIKALNSDNVSIYDGQLDPDVAESIGREFYRGIAAVDEADDLKGAMIWEYKNLDEDAATGSEIYLIKHGSKKILKDMLNEYGVQAKEYEVSSSYFELVDIPGEAVEALKENGFEVTQGTGRDIELTVEDLKPISVLKKKVASNVVALEDLMELQFMQGVTTCIFNGKKGMVEDLEYIDKSWFDETTSACVITDGRISGMLLVHRLSSGTLMPVLLNAIGPDSRMDLVNLMVFTARRALNKYPLENRILIRRHNVAVAALAKKLFGTRQAPQVFRGIKGKES